MSYHKDEECNSTIIQLLDALCTWERSTGRRSTLIIIPHDPDEEIVLAQDGKPLRVPNETKHAQLLLTLALQEREALK